MKYVYLFFVLPLIGMVRSPSTGSIGKDVVMVIVSEHVQYHAHRQQPIIEEIPPTPQLPPLVAPNPMPHIPELQLNDIPDALGCTKKKIAAVSGIVTGIAGIIATIVTLAVKLSQ